MDILDSFDEIKIGVAYKLDGKVLDSMPGTIVRDIIDITSSSLHLLSFTYYCKSSYCVAGMKSQRTIIAHIN